MNIKLENEKVQIIAECGLSHGGSLSHARKFIKLVKENGADIVKFQTHIADKESTYDEKFRIKCQKNIKIDLIIGKRHHFQNLNGKN